jgi:Zn-dependent protease
MEIFWIIASIIILIFSAVCHEVAHGFVANRLGDPTARLLGRLTLNPIPHIDPVGSLVVPGVLAILSATTGSGFIIGWAKPVPYNPANLRNPRSGSALIGAAGPLTNFAIAIVFGSMVRLMMGGILPATEGAILIFTLITYINIMLGIFNLVPIPPLDGSKVLFALAPLSARTQAMLEQNGFLLVLLFVMFFSSLLSPIVSLLFGLITGISPGSAL